MAKKSNKRLLVSLDIGSSKVACLIAELKDDNAIELFGVGIYPTAGIKNGLVTDVDRLTDAIQHALEEAELISGSEIRDVYTNITGLHMQSANSHGMCAVKRPQEIAPGDLDHVLNVAKSVSIPQGQTILHVLQQDFVVDGQEGIREPLGMSGNRLEANYHLVTVQSTALNNLVKSVTSANIGIEELVLSSVAAAEGVLVEDEKELGVCMIDIGAAMSDLVVFSKGFVRHTAAIPVAGDLVTNDIAVTLRTSMDEAEKLKKEHGSAIARSVPNNMIEVTSIDGRSRQQISQQYLAQIIEARYEETLRFLNYELKNSGFAADISSGIVLTGGAAKIPFLAELAEQIFQLPVRIAVPSGVVGLEQYVHDPIYATGIGLLKYARDFGIDAVPVTSKPDLGKILKKTFQWFGKNV